MPKLMFCKSILLLLWRAVVRIDPSYMDILKALRWFGDTPGLG